MQSAGDNSWIGAGEAARVVASELKRVDQPDGPVMARARPILERFAMWPWWRPVFAAWLKTPRMRDA
jgi:hypothetical protein